MANTHKSSLFKLYVDALAEQKSEIINESTPYDPTHRFFEMLANNLKEDETENIFEN
jgi:hypothetical protein